MGEAVNELTESWLRKAAGWKAVNEAKSLLEAGSVITAQVSEEGLVKGEVREGRRRYASGLLIRGQTDVENLCSCRESREFGTLCGHSVAVALLAGRAPTIDETASKAGEAEAVESVVDEEISEFYAFRLPPNFSKAMDRPSMVLEVERVPREGMESSGGNLEIGTKVRGKVLEWCAGQEVPRHLVLGRPQWIELLEVLPGSGLLTDASGDGLVVDWLEDVSLTVCWQGDNARLQWPKQGSWITDKSGQVRAWFDGKSIQVIRGEEMGRIFSMLHADPVWPPERQTELFLEVLPRIQSVSRLHLPADWEARLPPPGEPRAVLEVSGDLQRLQAELRIFYGDHEMSKSTGPSFTYCDESTGKRLRRSITKERNICEKVRNTCFYAKEGQNHWISENPALSLFRLRVEKWNVLNVEVRFSSAQLRNTAVSSQILQPDLKVVGQGVDWLEVDYRLTNPSGHAVVSAAEINTLLRGGGTQKSSKQAYLIDSEQLQDLEEVFHDLQARQTAPGRFRVEPRQAPYLFESAGLGSAPQGSGHIEKPDHGLLEQVLREYQKHGVDWLHQTVQRFGGALLADDMGLGKTLQILSLLQNAVYRPALVVCPAVLIHNWQAECRKFTPHLAVRTLEAGSQEISGEDLATTDLLVTSYGMLRSREWLKDWRPASLVMDEAQMVRNPDTQIAKTVRSIAATYRFALTGTPVENSVRDLWSLMAVLAPGYLGSRQEFRDRYEKPIADRMDESVLRRLRRRMGPFLLRRTKKEAAPELPPKLEQVLRVPMTPDQAGLYRQVLEAGQARLAARPEDRMAMFTLLLRLRQICCDPGLVGKGGQSLPGKVELFRELIRELADGGHRALVFSQFSSMLRRLAKQCREEGLAYCYLDGSTTDRAAQVEAFQAGQTPLFLISLKAGGVGLNLTAADTVIHFDPWWNPSVEAQATDRAYRIGQERPVTVYKLIAEKTVEEKILDLQARKKAVVEGTVESEEPVMEGLGTEEIRGLLA